MMKKTSLLIAGLIAAMIGLPQASQAAEGGATPTRHDWTFGGMFGYYDRAQLQRGFKVYREVCAACHALSLVSFRNLSQKGGPEFSTGQIQALAAEYKVMDGPNDQGEMFERPGRPADKFPKPFPNEQAARAAMGGAYPPDMSVIAKARSYSRGFPWFLIDALPFIAYQEHGPDYVASLLKGYVDPPAGVELQPGQYYNLYMPGNAIAMPNPLSDGQVEYPKGPDGRAPVPETAAQYAEDVTAFLMWAAEPHLEARKQMGFKVIIFLIVFAGLMYFTKKKIWSDLHGDTAKA